MGFRPEGIGCSQARRCGKRCSLPAHSLDSCLMLIWLFQQTRAPLCLLHSESPRHGALLKQPDKHQLPNPKVVVGKANAPAGEETEQPIEKPLDRIGLRKSCCCPYLT